MANRKDVTLYRPSTNSAVSTGAIEYTVPVKLSMAEYYELLAMAGRGVLADKLVQGWEDSTIIDD